MFSNITLSEQLECNTVGRIFEKAAVSLHCYETTFCAAWLKSDLCKRILSMEESLACQSITCLLDSFTRELKIPQHDKYHMNKDVMYWLGYMLTYWMLSDKTTDELLLKQYNIGRILEDYDILHVMPMDAVIKTIKQDYIV